MRENGNVPICLAECEPLSLKLFTHDEMVYNIERYCKDDVYCTPLDISIVGKFVLLNML